MKGEAFWHLLTSLILLSFIIGKFLRWLGRISKLMTDGCFNISHSVPEWVFKKINSSEMWCIFLKTIWQFQRVFLKIFWLHPSPLDTPNFWKKHPREKWQKVDPHYFSLSSLFSKNPSRCLKTAKNWNFTSKTSKRAKSWYF